MRKNLRAGVSSMKFLYIGIDPVNFSPEAFRLDVLDKFNGVRQLGNEVDYICRDESRILSIIGGKETHFPISGDHTPEWEFFQYILKLLDDQFYDILYLKSRMLYPELNLMAQSVKTKKFGTKVIYEPTDWPIDEFFRKQLTTYRSEKKFHRLAQTRKAMITQHMQASNFADWVDTAVVFGLPARHIWYIPTIAVGAGIAADQIHVRTCGEALGEPISILAVVDNPAICGYERLFRGLKIYREKDFHESVTLDITGSEDATAPLREVASTLGVADSVHFLGEKSLLEINDLCATHTVGVSDLGLYLEDRIYNSSWLTKFYGAAGLPFLYAGEDIGMSSKVPFAFKVPNLDAPINMELVCEFIWRCRLNAGLAQQERRFAENHFDWRIIMKQILLFTATGKLEV